MQNFYIMIYYLIHYIISRKTLSTVCVWKYKCYFTGGDNHPIFPNTKFQEPFSVLKQCSRKFLRELLIYCFHACFLSHALEFKIFCTVAVWPQCHSNSFPALPPLISFPCGIDFFGGSPFTTLRQLWGGLTFGLARPFDAAGRLAEAFPDLQRPCVRVKEKSDPRG